MKAWISKGDAITLVWQAQARRSETVGSRASAIATLGEWRRSGAVRTKPDPSAVRAEAPKRGWLVPRTANSPSHGKHRRLQHCPVLYRRTDVVLMVATRLQSTRSPNPPSDDYDADLARLVSAARSRKRFELGIRTLGPMY